MKPFRTGAIAVSAALALAAGIAIAQTSRQDTGAGTQPDAATRGQSGPSTGTTGANAPNTNTTTPAAPSGASPSAVMPPDQRGTARSGASPDRSGTTGANAPTTNTTDPAAAAPGTRGTMPRSQADTGTTMGSGGMRSDPSMTISRAPRNDRG